MFGSRHTRTTHRAPARTGYTSTRRTHAAPRARGGLFSRRRAPVRTHHRSTVTTTTHHAPVAHHRRKPSMGDKISGALMKIKGSLTRRPGVKAAGTRRMHGTDGRGSRRHFRTRRY